MYKIILIFSILLLCTACEDPHKDEKGHYETRYLLIGKIMQPYQVWLPDEE